MRGWSGSRNPMDTKKIVLAALVACALLGLAVLIRQGGPDSLALPALGIRAVEQAVWSAEAMLSGLEEGGYRNWTPAQAAAEAARTLEAATSYDPRDGYPRPSGPEFRFVTGAPTGPWQVVLVPLPATFQVRIDGYGVDPHAPVVSKTVPCPGIPPR